MEKLPGDPRYPIVGTEYIFIGASSEELFNIILKLTEKYAPAFRCWNGSLPEIVTMKPEHFEILHGFSEKVISDRKKLLKDKQDNKSHNNVIEEEVLGLRKRLSFLDLLIEASEDGKVLNDIDIRQEVDTFMFEGHDTTSASLSWTLLLLGNHPDIQERVFEEVRNVLHDKLTPTSINELNEFKYLERVIKESLRLYPSVPAIIRHTKEEIQIDEYKIPPNVDVVLLIYCVHRDPKVYPNPEKFDPDRFLPENCVNRHPYAYVPFSAGSRNCVGQKFALYEEKTILASIINRYKVTAAKRMEDIQANVDLILRPKRGVLLAFERRS
ncbi:cytochrome p450 family 4 [Holotrichia oblita]|uniref:Cytochrome p450 family 4 n=1 Tax=Holotrichia oblita TaxID=644536 RepID=A0ACB9TBZ2_HOLOL|nr:cytochrome p450 family 4 [Holotrichia oblita]